MNTDPIHSVTCTVSQDIINTSEKENSRHCMVANALRERGFGQVTVTLDTVRASKDGWRYSWRTPSKAIDAIIRFDDGEKVKRFQFQLLNGTYAQIRRRPVPPAVSGRKNRKGISPKQPSIIHETRRTGGNHVVRVR